MRRLPLTFFRRDTTTVARELVGCIIKREYPDGRVVFTRITETEAYLPANDPACHASRGPTPRTLPMFEAGGVLYVYFIYGMHWCANIVTETKGRGCAVLLRATEHIYGPGRLAKFLELTGEHTGWKGEKAKGRNGEGFSVWVDDEWAVMQQNVKVSTRIGITKGAELPLRFHV